MSATAGVSQDFWAERNTTPDAIDAALREMLRERHAENRALAPARVLNLVVVVDRAWKGEIANRLDRVGRYHASRTILCAVEEGRETLDAVATMSFDDSHGAGVTPISERVEIDLGPRHLARLDTIVDPVLVSELQTMLWSPHGHDDAVQAMLRRIDVILVDSDDYADAEGLIRASELLRSAYVVDLAWLRTTPWRERLAAAFDPGDRLPVLAELEEVRIRHQSASTAASILLAGWLASRLGWEVGPLTSSDGRGARGVATSLVNDDRVEIVLEPVDQDAPGLMGVTVSWRPDCSLSLDRSRGGLSAHERHADGSEKSWLVLGASRGEGGILGEGVRQALLRDPTYGPALELANRLAGAAGSVT